MATKERSYHFLEKVLMLFTALLGLILVALAVFGNNGIITYTQLHQNYHEMELRVEELNRENKRLAEEISGLRNDPFIIERIAREDLGMVKPGEVLYLVPQGGNK